MDRLVALVVLVGSGIGCGDGSGSKPDAAVDAVAIDAPDEDWQPVLAVVAFDNGDRRSISATFPGETLGPGWCAERASGPCTVIACRPFSPSGRHAGTISVSGDVDTVDMEPNAQGAYATEQTAVFTEGASVTVTAAGAAIPAFTATVVAPPTLSLTSSATPTISRAAGHTVTWSTTSTGTVLYSLIQQVDGLDRYVQCAFDAAAGSGTIAAEQLAELPVFGAATYSLISQRREDVATAAGPVRVIVRTARVAANANIQP